MNQFEQFKAKEKFSEDSSPFYPGIADPTLQQALTDKINRAADDFMEVANSHDPSAEKYQEKIGIGLKRFSELSIELDTEDREQICSYFEELMDMVELESSAGHLNNFMYGFDPTE
ncbi:MAG: DUF4844 domain-containing protein [Bacteroidota bacterium]